MKMLYYDLSGVRVLLRSRHFLSQNFDTFKRTPVRVSKMNAFARAQLTFQMLTLLKNIYNTRAIFKNMGQQMSGPDSSNDS